MAGQSSQSNNRGADLFGYFVSGKHKEYHTNQFASTYQPQGLTATGGVVSDYTVSNTVYRAHVFTSSGTFDVSSIGNFGSNIEYLVVAGGGAGGGTSPAAAGGRGGGGAGGLRTNLPGVQTAGGTPLTGSAIYSCNRWW